jgi:uncharacterized protein involved in high-affinity Fe2+ transport
MPFCTQAGNVKPNLNRGICGMTAVEVDRRGDLRVGKMVDLAFRRIGAHPIKVVARFSVLALRFFLLGTAAWSQNAAALEYKIGEPLQRYDMQVQSVYLQPVAMEPDGMMKKTSESDIHLEANVTALAGNPNGFAKGAWIPYLVVKYEVSKVGSTQKISGELMPMVANDGPHYGENIKLFGPGKYHVKYTILPPTENQHAHFGRHTDRQTGVAPWFKPFDVENDFTFVGIGKKGGY